MRRRESRHSSAARRSCRCSPEPRRATHDYRRHGTTNLYAALDVAPGLVISDLTERYRSEEFRRFLNLVDRSVPERLEVHVIVDDSSTRKTSAIHRWLLRHPRFTFHFTPTYSSWLNLVERWFAELTERWLRRGNHRSTKELVASILTWIIAGTRTRDRPSGTRPPMRSSRASPPIASGSLTRDTGLTRRTAAA
jgi:transposase